MGKTVRTPKIEKAIVEGLCDGIPLRQLCRVYPISKSEVYRWMEEDEAFRGRIAHARAVGFDEIAEESLEIIDEEPERVVTMMGDERSESRIDSASVARAKNRAEHRLKLLAKWDPKRYGEKTLHGSDPDNPLPPGFAVTLHKAKDSPDA